MLALFQILWENIWIIKAISMKSDSGALKRVKFELKYVDSFSLGFTIYSIKYNKRLIFDIMLGKFILMCDLLAPDGWFKFYNYVKHYKKLEEDRIKNWNNIVGDD